MILNGYRYRYEKRLIYISSLNIKVGVFVTFAAVLVDSLLQLWSRDFFFFFVGVKIINLSLDIKVGAYQGHIQ